MDYYFDRGTELLEDHYAIFRGSLDKFTRNKRLKVGVGEDAIVMPDFSDGNKGKTKVDETNGNDQTDVDEMDDDEAQGSETNEDMDKQDVQHDSKLTEHLRVCGLFEDEFERVPDTRSPMEKVMDDVFVEFLAERISNYEDLIDISDKFLENLRKDDVSIAQHEKLVSQFWENEQFQKGLCEELLENVSLFERMALFARSVDEEESHQKVDRIKKDPTIEKLLDEKDRVVIMRWILGILIGYWINEDMLIAWANEMDASDDVPKLLKYRLWLWSRL